jgi:hypothetical protein
MNNTIRMPAYYEIADPDNPNAKKRSPFGDFEGTIFVPLDRVLADSKVRGEVVASLMATAERLEAQAAEQRQIAGQLVTLASQKGGES